MGTLDIHGTGEGRLQTDDLHARWRVSSYDLRRGVPHDLMPHVVASAVAGCWAVAPITGGSGALRWLGAAVLVVQVGHIAVALGRRLQHAVARDRVLTVRGTSFVLTDTAGATTYDAPLAGVEDDHGVLRLYFTDGTSLEAPWRAFSNAALRRVRRHLRSRIGDEEQLEHLPVRRAGEVQGAAAWRRPVAALLVAAALALLPWLLPTPDAAATPAHNGAGGVPAVAVGGMRSPAS